MNHANKICHGLLFGLAGLMLILAAGCGGGGGGSAALVAAPAVESGEIAGVIETGALAGAARATGLEAARKVEGAQVYAYPAGTPGESLIPSGAVPSAVTDAQGRFVITGVPPGNHTLVVDVDADGSAEGLVLDVAVEKKKTTECGTHKAEQLQPAPEPAGVKNRKGTWCDVSLDKVIYATGETLKITLQGKNETDQDLICGVLINLRKGQDHPEQWRSDFTDASTVVIIPANGSASGTVYKIIPEEWALTNTSKGSDYQVFPILPQGSLWEKGGKDNFNILKEKPCLEDNSCEDEDGDDAVPGDDGTVTDPDTGDDGSVDPGTGDGGVVEPAPGDDTPPADDGSATDPGAGDTVTCGDQAVTCSSDRECEDGNPYTFDVCVSPGTCDSWCTQGDG